MNAGKTQYRLIKQDGSSYISQEFDRLEQALGEIFTLMLKGNIKSILINNMAVDESYLESIEIKFNRFPKQTSLWTSLKKWWSSH